MAGLSKKESSSFQDSLHILTTQIETINQQLAGGVGGGSNPAMLTTLRDVSAKVAYLYQALQGLQTLVKAESQGTVQQLGAQLRQGFQKELENLSAQIAELQQSLGTIVQALRNSPSVNAQDIQEIRKTIHELATIYREESQLFRRQNEFLQQRLVSIEKKLGALKK